MSESGFCYGILSVAMKIADYLERIHILQPAAPGLPFLCHLQEQHLHTVPFENLSIASGEPIVLDLPSLYAKIVDRRRGGFCYELNGLFGWLLTELGFAVTYVAAGVYNGERQEFGPTFDHMALLVQLDRTYLVDVGFGDSARTPLPMPEQESVQGDHEDISGRYRIVRDADGPLAEPGTYILQRAMPLSQPDASDDASPDWQPQYRFTPTPRILSDYVEMCHFHQTSPDSPFTRRMVCTRATADGRITLTQDTWTVTRNRQQTKTPITAEAERLRLLRDHFAMVLC